VGLSRLGRSATPGTSGGRALPTKSTADGARYSIRVTSRLTAIELDTLRVWERRYGFPCPERTSGGGRLYTEGDVAALKLIRRALEQGYRPGEVVGKSREELAGLILTTARAPTPADAPPPTFAALLATLLRDDVVALRAELRRAAALLGPKRFVVDIAHPLCARVGELWAEGLLAIRHEHVLTECLATQLRILASGYEADPAAPSVLLSTLPGERHGLGLQMVAVYLTTYGVHPILLGVETPPDQIVVAARAHQVDAVGLLVSRASEPKAAVKHLRWMVGELPRRVVVWVGGGGGPELPLRDPSVRLAPTWRSLDQAIRALPSSKGLA
jgi:methylmalonyl-CoA mutase cobalamin-binding subunit